MLTGEGRAHHGDILREATQLIEAGKLAPRVDPRRFTLSTVGDAYRVAEGNDAAGKIVVDTHGCAVPEPRQS
jgi:NADPH:quinone reductase-like Zn-dependent oxidoreductase